MTNLALVGVGKWGKNIVSTFETMKKARLKYLCSKKFDALESFSNQYEKLTDWRELLQKKDLNAVLIATPPSTHAKIAIPFLEKGLPVFVEKPMVLKISEAKKLQIAVKKSKQIFMVGFQYVFNDYIEYLKKEIEKGTLGKILSIKSEFVQSPPREDTNIFWDAGPHPLSVFQYLFNPKKLGKVEGKIEHNSAFVKIQFENSPTLEIITRCFGDKKTRKLTFTGEKAVAVLDETLGKNKLSITKNSETLFPEINLKTPLQNELEHFLHCVRTEDTPLTNVDFGYQITKWLIAISEKIG